MCVTAAPPATFWGAALGTEPASLAGPQRVPAISTPGAGGIATGLLLRRGRGSGEAEAFLHTGAGQASGSVGCCQPVLSSHRGSQKQPGTEKVLLRFCACQPERPRLSQRAASPLPAHTQRALQIRLRSQLHKSTKAEPTTPLDKNTHSSRRTSFPTRLGRCSHPDSMPFKHNR